MIQIRPERPDDAFAIHQILVACFPTDAEARLVELLRQSGNLTVSLVAEVDGAIVGHVAFSPVSVASGEIGMGLAPVAVLESWRRKGIASQLIQAGLQNCRDRGFGWSVVLGEPHYYSRFGYVAASQSGLVDAYHGGDAFQALELIPGALPVGAGLVQYAPEFKIFG